MRSHRRCEVSVTAAGGQDAMDPLSMNKKFLATMNVVSSDAAIQDIFTAIHYNQPQHLKHPPILLASGRVPLKHAGFEKIKPHSASRDTCAEELLVELDGIDTYFTALASLPAVWML